LGHSDDPDVESRLTPFTQAQTEPDAGVRGAPPQRQRQNNQLKMKWDKNEHPYIRLSHRSVFMLEPLWLSKNNRLITLIKNHQGDINKLYPNSTTIIQQK
ncbi:urea ABC transporter permease subunit UrtB, partial [Enterobacter asburiae]